VWVSGQALEERSVKRFFCSFSAVTLLCSVAAAQSAPQGGNSVRLITVDPAHFHAALIQKEMYPGVAKRVYVYAPLGNDLTEHLLRISRFNTRKDNPTSWDLDVRCSPDFMARMLKERPGNVVVFAGRNRIKIDRIKASVDAGLNVLADKPWILVSEDLPKVKAALDAADRRGLIAYDIMTERFEITSLMQRVMVNDPAVFGTPVAGTPQDPGVYMESVHHLMKTVAGVPSLRPVWFFDVHEQGEGLSDVGTHLVDLVQWTLFPEKTIDYRADIKVLSGKRWPTVITKSDFQRVTGAADFPDYLAKTVKGDRLDYYCNNSVVYSLKGIHVKLDVLWRYEAPAGTGDTLLAAYRGSKARIEVRQSKAENFRPELFIRPNTAALKAEVLTALKKRVEALQKDYPGVTLEEQGKEFHVAVPDKYRVGHEAHFAQVTNQFFKYLKNPKLLPAWEKPNMLAKYYVCTKGVEIAQ
jgi:predicted dehydrogenase